MTLWLIYGLPIGIGLFLLIYGIVTGPRPPARGPGHWEVEECGVWPSDRWFESRWVPSLPDVELDGVTYRDAWHPPRGRAFCRRCARREAQADGVCAFCETPAGGRQSMHGEDHQGSGDHRG